MFPLRIERVVASVCLIGAFLLAGCAGESSGGNADDGISDTGKGLKFAVVESYPAEDGGYNTQFRIGVDAVKKEFPDAVTTIVDQIDPGAAGQKAMSRLASQGYTVIIANGNFQADVEKVAPKFPKTKFMSNYGTPGKNIGIFENADEQGGYANGVLAANMTKSGTIGFVSSYMLGFEARTINAFMQGAKTVRPDVKMKVLVVNSFSDPAKERQAAQALVDDDADVIMQANADPASATVAEQQGVKYLGWSGDYSKQAPNAWLGGFDYARAGYFVDLARSLVNGTWKADIARPGIESGGIFFYDFGKSVPADVVKQVEAARKDIVSGKVKLFVGPVTDNTGKVVIPEGESISSASDLRACCTWLDAGIDGTPPQSGS